MLYKVGAVSVFCVRGWGEIHAMGFWVTLDLREYMVEPRLENQGSKSHEASVV